MIHILKQQCLCVQVRQSGICSVKWGTRKPRVTQWSVSARCQAEYKLHKLKIGVEFLWHFSSNRNTDPKHSDSVRWSVGTPLNLFYRAWLCRGREKMGFMTVKTGLPRTEGGNLRHPPSLGFLELLSSCSARKSEGHESAPGFRTHPKVRTHSNASLIRTTITAHLSV